ncbi:hypothetical protein RCL1_003778 [Eukaryota sp. TZLM3-RCL]
MLKYLLFCLLLVNILADQTKDSGTDLRIEWSRDLQVPLLSPPSIYKTDPTSYSLYVASISESLFALDTTTGADVPGFPFNIFTSLYSTPLLRDVNGDGLLDFMLATDSGHIIYLDQNARPLSKMISKVDPISAPFDWFKDKTTEPEETVTEPVVEEAEGNVQEELDAEQVAEEKSSHKHGHKLDSSKLPPEALSSLELLKLKIAPGPHLSFDQQANIVHKCDPANPSSQNCVAVPPHIFARPALGPDFIIVPVSFYFDHDFFEHNPFAVPIDVSKYMSSGVVCYRLVEGDQPIKLWQVNFDLVTASVDRSTFILVEPIIIDWFNTGKLIAIVVTSGGEVYALDTSTGSVVPNFPLHLSDSVSSPPLVVDVNGDGFSELILADSSGFVYCIDNKGKYVWKTSLKTNIYRPAPLASVISNQLVIFIGGSHQLFTLSAKDGSVIKDLSHKFDSPITTGVVPLKDKEGVLLALVTEDGVFRVFDPISSRSNTIDLQERVLSSLVVVGGDIQRIYIAAISGKVFCISFNHPGPSFLSELHNERRDPSTVSSLSLSVTPSIENRFSRIKYCISDVLNRTDSLYQVSLFIGSSLKFNMTHSRPGCYYRSVKLPGIIGKVHFSATVKFNGQVGSDSTVVLINTTTLDSLKWYAILPLFVVFVFLLLFKVSKLSSLPS